MVNTHMFERARRILNLDDFASSGSPNEIKSVNIECPLDEQYILRMLIRVDGKDFCVPEEISWIQPVLDEVVDYQRNVFKIEHSFCYVTIRHGLVKSETDDVWHVDGFSTRISHIPEQNYIWSNIKPTEWADLSVKFPDGFDPNIHNVNSYLSQFVNDSLIKVCDPQKIYVMDPYILHRRPIGTSGIKRTFLRISFVPIEINDIHNTQNPMFFRTYTQDGVLRRNTLLDFV